MEEDIKEIIAKNITDLRVENGMTQIDLAEKLNYSDKAVSKWERAKSLPDVTTLVQISDLFGVKLDYMVKSEHKEDKEDIIEKPQQTGFLSKKINKISITGMSILLVWLLATTVFVVLDLSLDTYNHFLTFIYAVPASVIVWLVFNTMW
ncbi:MAG: helix-turn-helix transcriptional regulator, partial [Clostridia bacterium]|nr:helix-turn-helix transcriptional regulator [Clostridia bacterium]